MRLLLDTHALIWAIEDNPRLSRRAAEAIGSAETTKLVSPVSAYEVVLKFKLGKLPGMTMLADAFAATIAELECVPLAVTVAHAEAAGRLELWHRDPFDRLLIAQALLEDVTLVSNEREFDRYGVTRLW